MPEETPSRPYWIIEQRPRRGTDAKKWQPYTSRGWIGWRIVVEASEAEAALAIARDTLDTVSPESLATTDFLVVSPPHGSAERAVAECCWDSLHGRGPASGPDLVVAIFADDYKVSINAADRRVHGIATRRPSRALSREQRFAHALGSEVARLHSDRIEGR